MARPAQNGADKAPTVDKNPVGTAMRKAIALLTDLSDEQRARVVASLVSLYVPQVNGVLEHVEIDPQAQR